MRSPAVLATRHQTFRRRLFSVADSGKAIRGLISQIDHLHPTQTLSASEAPATRHESLANMIGVSKIQHGITQYNHQLLVLSSELASQRTISRLCHYTLSDPLPELGLRGPELLAIAADHKRSLLLFLFLNLLFGVHGFGDFPRHLAGATPRYA